MTHYDHNHKPATAGSAFALRADGIAISGSGSLVKQSTTLDRCVDLQRGNMEAINQIARRIASLYSRMTNNGLKGSVDECGELQSEGVLGDHKSALELEARALGEIQADLAELEKLL